jgi:malic enzyme
MFCVVSSDKKNIYFPQEMAPLIYTPTVGQACQELSLRFRRPRGMYFNEEDRGQMASM